MALPRILKMCLIVLVVCFVAAPLQGQERYSFGGTVVSENGEPMRNVRMLAVPEDAAGSGAVIVTRTNATGVYRFENIPLGNYRIQAGDPTDNWVALRAVKFVKVMSLDFAAFFALNASGQRVLTQDSLTVPSVLDIARISLDANSPEQLDVVVLKSAYSVSGRVATPAGTPLPPRRLSVSSTTSTVLSDVKIQDDGTFEVPWLPPGTFELRVIPNLGLRNLKIKIDNQNLRNIEIGRDLHGSRVTGYVPASEKPGMEGKRPDWVYLTPPGATVLAGGSADVAMFGLGLVSTSGEPRHSIFDENGEVHDLPLAPVSSDGSFAFLSVPAGSYIARTLPDRGIPNSAIEIVGGVNLDNVQLGITVRVRGEVVPLNFGNRPPETITLMPAQPGSAGAGVSSAIDERGVFEFPKVGPGTYRVFLDGKPKAAQQQIEVGFDERFSRIETPFNSWVNGRIVFSGMRMSSEDLAAVHVSMTNGYDSSVDSDGSFRIKSNDGEYKFFITDLPEDYVVRSITYGSDDVMNAPFRVDASMSPREIMVTLDHKPGTSLPAR